jgi:chromosome segregation ATPase
VVLNDLIQINLYYLIATNHLISMTEKNTLLVIDGTLKAVEENLKQFTEVLLKAKNELIILEKDKNSLSNEKIQLEKEKEQLEKEKINLEKDKEQLEKEKDLLEKDKEKLEQDKTTLEKEKQERDEKIGALTEEQKQLLDEYESLKIELNKLAKIAEESQGAEFDFERIKALLMIYTVLIEKIWQGQPHYRILLVLHGEKEQMTRDELKNTTGIAGAFVIRAVNELANVGLLDYDQDTGMVKLKNRLFEKEALKEKK